MITEEGKRAISDLPDSFAKVALAGEQPREVSELQVRFALPGPLANFYASHAVEFQRIRSIRVAIEHHGKSIPHVFETESGFGVGVTGTTAWSGLGVWQTHELQPNGIGSVRALANFLASFTLQTLDDFEVALRRTIEPSKLPPAVSQGNRVYLRNPVVGRLAMARATGPAWETSEQQ